VIQSSFKLIDHTLSDHKAIQLEMTQPEGRTTRICRPIIEEGVQELVANLECCSWDLISNDIYSLDQRWEHFINTIAYWVDVSLPTKALKGVRKQKKLHWFSFDLQVVHNRLMLLQELVVYGGITDLRTVYKALKMKYKTMIRTVAQWTAMG